MQQFWTRKDLIHIQFPDVFDNVLMLQEMQSCDTVWSEVVCMRALVCRYVCVCVCVGC